MEMKSPKIEVVDVEEEEERRETKKWPLMKMEQLVEFQMQVLVYKYIEAGVRVPNHLVVPIWKSLALSSPSAASKYLIQHKNQPSPIKGGGKVELEPLRCRRTDGKKWRCSRKVLPLEKYCERHMNRGMNRGQKRSRKLVESSSYDVDSSSVSAMKQEDTSGLMSNNESQQVPHAAMPVSSNAQEVTVAALPSASVTPATLVISESINKRGSHHDRSRNYMNMSYDDFIKQRESSTRIRVRIPVAGDESLRSVQKLFPEASDISLEAAEFARNRKNDIIASGREWKNMNVNSGWFPGIHFSPDTVIQDRGGFALQRVETDNEPGKCRRTDGKKWRCNTDVLSGEKYCDNHMNRGVRKKHPVDTDNSIDNANFSPITMKPATTSASREDGHPRKLSDSFMGIPLYAVPDEKETSSCSTDTTVTDTDLMAKEDYEEVLSLCSSGV